VPAPGIDGVVHDLASRFSLLASRFSLLASRFSLLALTLGISAAEVSYANCANSGGPALQNGQQAHNVGEYWFDGEDTAYLISSWYDSEEGLTPLEDEDFVAPLSGGGGGTCEGPNCGGSGENPGLNSAQGKKPTGPAGGHIEACATMQPVIVTANRISGGSVGIMRLYIRSGGGGSSGGGSGTQVRGNAPKKHVAPANATCSTDFDSRQGAAGAAHLTITSNGVKTKKGDRLVVTYLDGKTESWYVMTPALGAGSGYASLNGFDANGQRMPSECAN
jgi:hypothetical protein